MKKKVYFQIFFIDAHVQKNRLFLIEKHVDTLLANLFMYYEEVSYISSRVAEVFRKG
jgi:dihydroneopterin aldolase